MSRAHSCTFRSRAHSCTIRQSAFRLAVGLVVGSVAASTGPVAAQDQGRTVWDGVYSEEQAERGRTAYARHCASCHAADLSGSLEARPLAGPRFMQDWSEDTVDTLYTRVRNLMPFDDPATLPDDIYLDSVAYILRHNGFPAGELDLDPERLADIRIQGRDGPGPVPSFSLVQVVGCLTAGPDGDWMLTGSTRAARTRDPAASDAEALAALADRAPGSATFSLMSVYPDPTEHAGHRMEVKGFLIRDPEGDRINVSALAMVAAACDRTE
ncbi:MAG: c-type cytochrome [Acidobacteria bacterium]|nr:c-type cytochrome [Acidobacteriota bacterium]